MTKTSTRPELVPQQATTLNKAVTPVVPALKLSSFTKNEAFSQNAGRVRQPRRASISGGVDASDRFDDALARLAATKQKQKDEENTGVATCSKLKTTTTALINVFGLRESTVVSKTSDTTKTATINNNIISKCSQNKSPTLCPAASQPGTNQQDLSVSGTRLSRGRTPPRSSVSSSSKGNHPTPVRERRSSRLSPAVSPQSFEANNSSENNNNNNNNQQFADDIDKLLKELDDNAFFNVDLSLMEEGGDEEEATKKLLLAPSKRDHASSSTNRIKRPSVKKLGTTSEEGPPVPPSRTKSGESTRLRAAGVHARSGTRPSGSIAKEDEQPTPPPQQEHQQPTFTRTRRRMSINCAIPSSSSSSSSVKGDEQPQQQPTIARTRRRMSMNSAVLLSSNSFEKEEEEQPKKQPTGVRARRRMSMNATIPVSSPSPSPSNHDLQREQEKEETKEPEMEQQKVLEKSTPGNDDGPSTKNTNDSSRNSCDRSPSRRSNQGDSDENKRRSSAKKILVSSSSTSSHSISKIDEKQPRRRSSRKEDKAKQREHEKEKKVKSLSPSPDSKERSEQRSRRVSKKETTDDDDAVVAAALFVASSADGDQAEASQTTNDKECYSSKSKQRSSVKSTGSSGRSRKSKSPKRTSSPGRKKPSSGDLSKRLSPKSGSDSILSSGAAVAEVENKYPNNNNNEETLLFTVQPTAAPEKDQTQKQPKKSQEAVAVVSKQEKPPIKKSSKKRRSVSVPPVPVSRSTPLCPLNSTTAAGAGADTTTNIAVVGSNDDGAGGAFASFILPHTLFKTAQNTVMTLFAPAAATEKDETDSPTINAMTESIRDKQAAEEMMAALWSSNNNNNNKEEDPIVTDENDD